MSSTTIDIEETELQNEAASSGNIERFLTFVSDNITFGVSTNHVVEIISNYMIRSLPMVPGYIKGIINLRGKVIPIIDIRLRMGKPFHEYTSTTCIIIVNIEDTDIGIIVDSVTQVLDIDLDHTSPIPVQNRQELTTSMTALEDGSVVLFLDCEQLLHQ